MEYYDDFIEAPEDCYEPETPDSYFLEVQEAIKNRGGSTAFLPLTWGIFSFRKLFLKCFLYSVPIGYSCA